MIIKYLINNLEKFNSNIDNLNTIYRIYYYRILIQLLGNESNSNFLNIFVQKICKILSRE